MAVALMPRSVNKCTASHINVSIYCFVFDGPISMFQKLCFLCGKYIETQNLTEIISSFGSNTAMVLHTNSTAFCRSFFIRKSSGAMMHAPCMDTTSSVDRTLCAELNLVIIYSHLPVVVVCVRRN